MCFFFLTEQSHRVKITPGGDTVDDEATTYAEAARFYTITNTTV